MAEWGPLVRPVQQALLGRQVLPGTLEQLAQLELQGRQAPLVLQVPLAPRELRESPVPRESPALPGPPVQLALMV